MGKKRIYNNLKITNRVLKTDNQAYQISNLIGVSKHEKKANPGWIFSLILTIININIFCLFFIALFSTFAAITSSASIFFLFISLIIRKVLLKFRGQQYILTLETNSGNINLLSSKDEEFVSKLVSIIAETINDQSLEVSYSIDIELSEIYDDFLRESI